MTAVEDLDYTPTPRQEAFRLAVAAAMEEERLPGENGAPKPAVMWKLPEQCRLTGPGLEVSVTPKEYKAWEREPGFLDWWRGIMAEWSPVAQAELAYAGRKYIESMVDNLRDPRSQSVFGHLYVANEWGKTTTATTEDDQEMQIWAGGEQHKAWMTGGVAPEGK